MSAKPQRSSTWFGRHKIQLGAVLSGLGACLAYVLGAEQITAQVMAWGILLGLLASLPALIFEEALKSRQRQGESTRPDEVSAQTAEEHPSPPQRDIDSRFQGRRAEMAALRESHDRQVQARSGAHPSGPVVLAIHGMPGVGKSMLARHVGSLLADQYPDGRLSENFGKAGGPAPPAEILKRLLLKLGRGESEIPDDAEEQANLLRSLTIGKRILFEFDAARNHDQVLQVLPTEPGCAVIISSRRDLTAQLNVPPGVALGPPPLEDALQILTAVSGFDWMIQAEHAVEVVELCGRLPGAIVAAAERVLQDRTDLRHVAEALRKPADRLSKLDYNGRGFRERCMSEYRRLLPRGQEALCLLTLVGSPTFIPWVLAPLLAVGRREAENVMAALGAAQLLENVGADEATGLARYRFNPLVRLFAEEQLRHYDEATVKNAREAFDTKYLALVDEVLALMFRDYRRVFTEHSSASMTMVAQRVAVHPEVNIRREYHNLLHLIPVALQRGHVELALRIAALLTGCVPMGEHSLDPQRAFEQTIRASRGDGGLPARTDVELALASYLVAVENYRPGFQRLNAIIDRPHREPSMPQDVAAEYRRRVVAAQRCMAEAFVQMGDYRNAEAWLDAAGEIARDVGSEEEHKLVSLLTADTHHIPDGDAIYEHLVDGHHLDDRVSFRALTLHSDEQRRRGQWSRARQDLVAAAEHSNGDARRMASVHYRLARLCIDQWRSSQPNQGFPAEAAPPPSGAQPPPVPQALAELPKTAVREAATAALLFRQMGNVPGVTRARCLLARALLIAGKPLAAERLLRTVRQSLSRTELTASPAHSCLLARYARAHGELQLHRHAVGAAWRSLCHAASRFESSNDFSSNEEIWQLLETISQNRPYPVDAELPDLAMLAFPHENELRPRDPADSRSRGIPQQRSPDTGDELSSREPDD